MSNMGKYEARSRLNENAIHEAATPSTRRLPPLSLFAPGLNRASFSTSWGMWHPHRVGTKNRCRRFVGGGAFLPPIDAHEQMRPGRPLQTPWVKTLRVEDCFGVMVPMQDHARGGHDSSCVPPCRRLRSLGSLSAGYPRYGAICLGGDPFTCIMSR